MFQPAESLYNVRTDKVEEKEKKPYKPKKREIFKPSRRLPAEMPYGQTKKPPK
jgi:hypothetical protein